MVAGKFEGASATVESHGSTTCAQQKAYRKNAAQPHRSGTKFEILTESVSACWKSDPQTVFRGVALGQHVKEEGIPKEYYKLSFSLFASPHSFMFC